MTVALDTNILAYAEGVDGPAEQDLAIRMIDRLPRSAVVLPIQVLGELFNVLVRKARRPASEARTAVMGWRDIYMVAPTTEAALASAVDLAADHRFGMWDAIILSVAAEAGCRFLLSQDLQAGFRWRGVTVADPLAQVLDPALSLYIGADP
ncbi:MAG: PIN domain-containing protein [Alphaproteobacteria bacterium]|nr:PIN domain-containing protein [Alphaproteobacteria bacterium]